VSRWALIAVAIAMAGSLAAASGAGACSCASLDPREALEQFDSAVIGTALWSEPVNGRRLTHLRVERAFKAELGAEVVVDTGRADGGGADCSLALADGSRVGLYLSRTDAGGWSTGLCSLVDPDELEQAAGPMPLPLGRGRVALVAGLGLDGYRLAALDARAVVPLGREVDARAQPRRVPGYVASTSPITGTRAPWRVRPGVRMRARGINAMT
jgi:hypothetical protein